MAEFQQQHRNRPAKKRRTTETDWDQYRLKLTRLWHDERKTKREIVNIMIEEDGLDITEKQLKHRFEVKWKMAKYKKRKPRQQNQQYQRATKPLGHFTRYTPEVIATHHADRLPLCQNQSIASHNPFKPPLQNFTNDSLEVLLFDLQEDLPQPLTFMDVCNSTSSKEPTMITAHTETAPEVSQACPPLQTNHDIYDSDLSESQSSPAKNAPRFPGPKNFLNARLQHLLTTIAVALDNTHQEAIDPLMCVHLRKLRQAYIEHIEKGKNSPVSSGMSKLWGRQEIISVLDNILSWADSIRRQQHRFNTETVSDCVNEPPQYLMITHCNQMTTSDSPYEVIEMATLPMHGFRTIERSIICPAEIGDSIGINIEKSTQPTTVNGEGEYTLVITFIPWLKKSSCGVTIILPLTDDYAFNSSAPVSLGTFNVIQGDANVISHIKEDNISGFKNLIQSGMAHSTDVTQSGNTLLMYAIRHGRPDIFKLLVPNLLGIHSYQRYTVNLVKYIWDQWILIAFGQRRTVLTPSGVTTLWSAHTAMRLTKIALATKWRVQIPTSCDLDFPTPLFPNWPDSDGCCSTIGEVVTFLKKIGFDLEQRNKAGQTPLLYAAYSTQVNSNDWMEALIDNRAEVHAVDGYGRGALHSVLFLESIVMERIYDDMQCHCGRRARATDWIALFQEAVRDHGSVPYPELEISGIHPERLRPKLCQLLALGCNPNALDNSGESPGDYTRRKNYLNKEWEFALHSTGWKYVEGLRQYVRTICEEDQDEQDLNVLDTNDVDLETFLDVNFEISN